MDSVSEDVPELSLAISSQMATTKKVRDMDRRFIFRPVSTPKKPGRKHHPKGSTNDYQERSNPPLALGIFPSRC
jgi:hypothetical protein